MLTLKQRIFPLIFTMVVAVCATLVQSADIWKKAKFTYPNTVKGGGASDTAGDTLIGTTAETLKVSADGNLRPKSLIIQLGTTQLTAGDTVTIRLDKGAFGVYTDGTLDTFMLAAGAGYKQLDFSASEPTSRDWRIVLGHTASAGATDSSAYRISVRFAYNDNAQY